MAFLVVEEQDSTSSSLNLPLLFISKAHDMFLTHEISERRHGYFPCHVNKSDIEHTCLEQQKKKIQKELLLLRPDLLQRKGESRK